MPSTIVVAKNAVNSKYDTLKINSTGELLCGLDSVSGAGNNNLGDGSVRLQTYCMGRDATNGQMKPLKLDTSGRLECSVDALEVTAETINLSTDTLETLITSTNTKLDTIETSCDALISANHTDLVTIETSLQSVEGKQDTQITHLSEIEGAVETIEACVSNDKVDINIASGNITGFSTSANQVTTQNKIDILETSLTSMESKQDSLISANHTDLVAIETSCDALISANHTDLIALEASLTAMEGKQDTQVSHLSEIEGAIETIEACVGSNKVNVNISSGGTDVSAISTHAKQDTIIGHLDGVEGKLDTIETSCDALISANHTDLVALEASLTAMEGKQDTQVTHLSEIEGAVETIEACVGSNKVNVNISSGNISGFATSALQTTLINDIGDIITDTGDILTAVQDLEASLTSMEDKQGLQTTHLSNIHTKNTEIDTAVDAMSAKLPASLGQKANASSISTCRSTTAGAYDMSGRTTIGTASTTTKLLCDSDGHLQVDVVSGGVSVSALSTHAKQDTIIGHLDGVEGKLDTIETTNNACQVLLGTIDSDTNDIKTAVEILDDIVLTEDTAHSSGHKGVMSLVVRQDSQADFGADGDYVPMSVNGSGELRVTTGGGSVSKTTVQRTVARDLATRGSHADWTVDTGTEANFISFYIDFIDTFDTDESNLQVQYSTASNFANPIVVFQGGGTTITEYNNDGSTYKRGYIELKNPARYVRLFNDNSLTAIPVEGGIIIHGRE